MIRTSRLLRFACLAAFALTASCASTSTARSSATPAERAADANVLTAAEIEHQGAQEGSIYDAIRRLRPRYLQYRGISGTNQSAGKLLVSVDNGALDEIGALRAIPARQVVEVRYLSAADAAQRFGTTANSSPVILVRQR